MHFPLKLYQLVQAGPADVISWSDNGKSFLVVDADMFCNKILPKHFRHNKLTSFQRQLNLYGFQRIAKGTEAGRYYHPLFDKNRPDKLSSIKRESRSGMLSSNEVDEQILSLTDEVEEDSETPVNSNVDETKPVPSRVGTRSCKQTQQIVPPVIAGPEDHTAALAMINISRSLSSESACSDTEATLVQDVSSSPCASQQDVVAPLEFEQVLKESLARQSALEEEVVQLKSLVKVMMAKIEELTSNQSVVVGGTSSSLSSLSNSTSTCSIESLCSEDGLSSRDIESKRRWNDDDEPLNNAKRIKDNSCQSLTLSSPFVVSGSTPGSSPEPLSPDSGTAVTLKGGFEQ